MKNLSCVSNTNKMQILPKTTRKIDKNLYPNYAKFCTEPLEPTDWN